VPILFEDKISFEDIKPKPLKLGGDIGNASNQDLSMLKMNGILSLGLNEKDKISLLAI